jgi:hypothetical protein
METEQIAVVALPFVFGICLMVYTLRWQYRTAEARLRGWAEKSQYTLLEQQRANPAGTGPMTRSAISKQVVYRVVVATPAGVRRSALVRIGSSMAGVLSQELSVEWQDG